MSKHAARTQENLMNLPALSGTCLYALDTIKSHLKELNNLAAAIKKNPEQPADCILWDVKSLASRVETLHSLFNEGYERHAYFTEKEKAEMAKRKKAKKAKKAKVAK